MPGKDKAPTPTPLERAQAMARREAEMYDAEQEAYRNTPPDHDEPFRLLSWLAGRTDSPTRRHAD